MVVDDEPQIQRFLRPALEAEGFEVLPALRALEADRLFLRKMPHIVILDLGLPDRDGKTVIGNLRTWSNVPIVVLSARGHEREKIEALDLGADDYVEKPFGIGELLARLRGLLRRPRAGEPQPVAKFCADGLVVDTDRRLLTRNDEVIRLTPKEYNLLLVLIEHAGKVLTHKQLLTTLWGRSQVQNVQYLRVLVGQLRRKIECDPDHPRLIINEPRIGYRLIANEL
jgi:two-component system KDP operon response regulator KdpE